MHQGDLDGVKGVYQINAVDELTQWQIAGFHSNHGSEFINHTRARPLNKLLVEQTKSRLRYANDNGLARRQE